MDFVPTRRISHQNLLRLMSTKRLHRCLLLLECLISPGFLKWSHKLWHQAMCLAALEEDSKAFEFIILNHKEQLGDKKVLFLLPMLWSALTTKENFKYSLQENKQVDSLRQTENKFVDNYFFMDFHRKKKSLASKIPDGN